MKRRRTDDPPPPQVQRWPATIVLTGTGTMVIELDDHVTDETIAAGRIRTVVFISGPRPKD